MEPKTGLRTGGAAGDRPATGRPDNSRQEPLTDQSGRPIIPIGVPW
jgi:hypothetical protein